MLAHAIARDSKKMYEEELEKGEMKGKRLIARALPARDMAFPAIAAITGLSKVDIRKIT